MPRTLDLWRRAVTEVVRWELIVGVAIFGSGQVVEGLGAFGYQDDGLSPANDWETSNPAHGAGQLVTDHCRLGTGSNVTWLEATPGGPAEPEAIMSHSIVHAEIRSSDPDATRAFFGELFGWTYPTEGAFPGYTFVETGVPGALYTAISPLQGDGDLVTFFVGVEDMGTAIADVARLGGRLVQEPVSVPGVSFALIADPQGHVVGLAQQV